MTKQNVAVAAPSPGLARAVAVAAAAARSSPLSPSAAEDGVTGNERRRREGRAWRWADSLRASSPTHHALVSHDRHSTDWIKNHPSALEMFDQIAAAAAGKRVVMFLDYDGTLSPIVDDPDRAFMSDSMRETVQKVAAHFPTAIVSGRSRHKVYEFVQLDELYYAGSHGMDIRGPSRRMTESRPLICQPAHKFLPIINDVYEELMRKTKSTRGAKVENNRFCLSVHFRRVEESKWGGLAREVKTVVNERPELRLTLGRKVLEIRPAIEWDKGKALEFLLQFLGFSDWDGIFPIYIGDDRTDEDAFKILRKRGQGLGILVSKFPKDTDACYSLREPAEVMDFLQRMVAYYGKNPSSKEKILRGFV